MLRGDCDYVFVSVEARNTALFGIGMGNFVSDCNVGRLFHSDADAARSRQSFHNCGSCDAR